jgi:hypothetical protein
MFKVEAGTEILAIRDGDEWIDKNFRRHITERENVFDPSEIIFRPSSSPRCITIGDVFAAIGYWAFRRDGWAMLVPSEYIIAQ